MNLSTHTYLPTAEITVQKNQLKKHGKTVYLEKDQEFEIYLKNTSVVTVLAKINLNGDSISHSGLILRPGEQIFLERYLDQPRKFKFHTYQVSKSNKKFIENNGLVEIEFFKEILNGSSIVINNTNWTYTHTHYPYNPDFTNSPIFMGDSPIMCNFQSQSENSGDSPIVTGKIEAGKSSNQSFSYENLDFSIIPFHTITWKILPKSSHVTVDDIVNYCTSCRKKIKKMWNYCPKCGTEI